MEDRLIINGVPYIKEDSIKKEKEVGFHDIKIGELFSFVYTPEVIWIKIADHKVTSNTCISYDDTKHKFRDYVNTQQLNSAVIRRTIKDLM